MGTEIYLVAWEGYGDEENSWETYDNISDELIRDYERQFQIRATAVLTAHAEDEPEDEDDDDELMEVDVDPSEVEQVVPVEIVKHSLQWVNKKKYKGGLGNVWVMLKYSDGSRTPGYVSSEFLGDSKEGLDLSRAYTKKNRCTIGSTKVHAVGNIKQLKSFKQRPNQARIVYSAVKSIAWPFKSTLLYAQMNHIAIAGGDGPGGAAKGHIPNLLF